MYLLNLVRVNREESSINQLMVPPCTILMQKLFDLSYIRNAPPSSNRFEAIMLGNPIILPYPDSIPIPNIPTTAFVYDPKRVENTPPNITRRTTY